MAVKVQKHELQLNEFDLETMWRRYFRALTTENVHKFILYLMV